MRLQLPIRSPVSNDDEQHGQFVSPDGSLSEQPMIAPFQTEPTQMNPQQWNYYQNIQDFTEELKHIKGMLEGKIIARWDKEGSVWEYPAKKMTYIEITEPNEKSVMINVKEHGKSVERPYILQELIDYSKTVPTGNYHEVAIPVVKPFCNAEGQTYIFNWCATRLQRGTPNTSYSIERIFFLLRADVRDLERVVYIKRKEWQANYSAFPALLSTLMDRIEAARRRALEGNEFLATSKQTNVNIVGAPPAPKQSPMGFLSMPRTRY